MARLIVHDLKGAIAREVDPEAPPSNIVDFDRHALPHANGAAKCVGCQKTWQAVIPYDRRNDFFECPFCRDWKGRYYVGYAPYDEEVLRCEKCGNEVWFVCRDITIRCPGCGNIRVWPSA